MHSKNQKRHGSPSPSRTPLVPMKPKAPAVTPTVVPSPGGALAFRVPKEYPHSRFSKAPLAVYPPKGARNQTCVSLPVVSLEKIPCLSRGDPSSHVRLTSSSSSSSSPSHLPPPASQRSSEKLTNGRGPPTPRSTPSPSSSADRRPSPARSPLDRRLPSTPSPSPLDRKPPPSPAPSQRSAALPVTSLLEKKQQNGTKTPSRSQKRLSGRVFDPNKHCGVQDPETKRPCTRSLTCKTHSLTHRRAVSGRGKHFDVLLAEHKGRTKLTQAAKEKDASRGRKEGSVTPQETASPSRPHCTNGRTLSMLKLRLANAHMPRVPGSTSSPLPSAPPPQPSPLRDGGRLSSDEGDAETPEDGDRSASHSSHRHPQPLRYCVFSSRLMGRGHYVFDRRWDRMRLALQNSVEKHLNAHMWSFRKVPPAPESLHSLSSSGTSPVSSQPSPSSVPLPPLSSLSHIPPSASTVGALGLRVAPVRARNGTHKAPPPSSKDTEDSGAKRRKHASSFFPTVDNLRRNGSSHHPTLQSSGASAAGRKKGLGRGGVWSGGEDWLSRDDGSESYGSHSSGELGSVPDSPSRESPSAPPHPPAPPSVPLPYVGGAEGRKRRSPSSFKAKASKLSRPGGMESLFGSDSVGILASGPESPRQAKMHH
nr:LOW QUALITY PROTEIN: ataxin-7-like protein 1 [Pseudochaenichthys georgianus]